MNTVNQVIWTAAPETESSSIIDGNASSHLHKLKLDDLNYDVLRNIFDRLSLTDIVSVQRVCSRFEAEAHYRRPSAKFELHSVVMRRFGDFNNWLKETKRILKQYGKNITDLEADYNCFPGRGAIKEISENVLVFCTQLQIYTINGSFRYPNISAGYLLRPNLQALHTLRLCNFSRSTNDRDVVAAYLFECHRTLRTLHIENMYLTGEFLLNTPITLESLELIQLHNIDMNFVHAYLRRNPTLKRFELVTRGLRHCFPNTGFYGQISQVEHLKLQVDNRSPYMFPLNVGSLRNFVNLRSLELDALEMFNLASMFAGLAELPILERLSISLSNPLNAIIYQSLKSLKKLQFLKVKLPRNSITACQIESLIRSVSEAVRLTELEIQSSYGGNLLPMFIYLPHLQKIKLEIGGCYTNLKSMAYVRYLSKFQVRLGGDLAIKSTCELIEEMVNQRPINRLTVMLLSSTEFQQDVLLGFEKLAEIGIKSFPTKDAYELGRIAEGRTFEVLTDALKNFRLITDLVKGTNWYDTHEIVITGDVGSKYSELGHVRNCGICSL